MFLNKRLGIGKKANGARVWTTGNKPEGQNVKFRNRSPYTVFAIFDKIKFWFDSGRSKCARRQAQFGCKLVTELLRICTSRYGFPIY